MSGALLVASLPGGPKVTLSGHSNSAGNSGATATASFKVDNDGKMYQRDNSESWVQIDAALDWVRPLAVAPGPYRVRYTGASGDTGSLSAVTAEDEWQNMSLGDWVITVTDTDAGPAGKAASFTIEIDDGASGGASGTYSLSANREDA